MNQQQIDGLELGHSEAERAGNNAGADWMAKAYEIFIRYAKLHVMFTTEEVRIHAHSSHYLPLPPDSRAWGAVVGIALRQKLLKKVGQSNGKLRACHGGYKTIWEYKGK